MNIKTVFFFLLVNVLMVVPTQASTVSGMVANIDFVGSTIAILTANQEQMSFYVPGNAVITRNTHDIGLMDIKEGHPVTIKYDASVPGKNVVESIIDSPVVHE